MRWFVFSAAILSLVSQAHAETVTFEFTAVVTEVLDDTPGDLLGSLIEEGDEVKGTFRYSLDLGQDPTTFLASQSPAGPTQHMTLTNTDGNFEFESNGEFFL